LVVEYLTSTIDACVIYADGVLLLSHSVMPCKTCL